HEPFTKSTIGNLIVILQEVHEGERRQMRARLTAWLAADGGTLALIDKTFCQRPTEPLERVCRIVRVVAFRLMREYHMKRMVKVVIPLRHARSAQAARLVVIVLEHDMHVTLTSRPVLDRIDELVDKVPRPIVVHGVHRIDPQPVETRSE